MKSSNYLLLIALSLISCVPTEENQFAIFSQSYDFNLSKWGWEAGFTDYPVSPTAGSDTIYHWETQYSTTPSVDANQRSLMLSCNNESGDIFMFIKKKVSGLHPNKTYSLVFSVGVASNIVDGNGILLKAGASFVEPQKVIHNERYELNLDKGENTKSGADLFLLGLLDTQADQAGYLYNTLDNALAPRRFTVQTNNLGEMWLIVGAETSAPGINTIYFQQIRVVFSAGE